ncbi:MAG TPA: cytidine deaminase [Virgibacillus sp.]|nr:cytidine deaminase [Virgibacillus sp.]
MNKENLIEEAIKARERAYVPYSRFPVGAAVVTTDGNVYTGCNIENAAFPVSCCAERVALFSAIANGEKTFKAMAVVADSDRPVPPCGSCRQVMSEFFGNDTTIYLSNLKNQIETLNVESLLPFSFQPEDLHSAK